MKICIAATGSEALSQVAPMFGRAPYFLFTEDGERFEAVANIHRNHPSGSGLRAARLVIERGTEFVFAGNCGPYAKQALTMAGIRILPGIMGTVRESVRRFQEGELALAPQAPWPPVSVHRFGRRGRGRGCRGISRAGGSAGRGKKRGVFFAPPLRRPADPERELLIHEMERRTADIKTEVERLKRRIEELDGGSGT